MLLSALGVHHVLEFSFEMHCNCLSLLFVMLVVCRLGKRWRMSAMVTSLINPQLMVVTINPLRSVTSA